MRENPDRGEPHARMVVQIAGIHQFGGPSIETGQPGLTVYGAATGMLTGGLLSMIAIVSSMLLDKKVLTFEVSDRTTASD